MESQSECQMTSDYSLGREIADSVELLFNFFCNNLSLGQWEVALACLPQLVQSADHKQKIKGILRDVIEHPYSISVCGGTVTSPHHLSWLCLTEYKKLFVYEIENEDLDFLTKDIEFRLLLHELADKASPTVIKELYQYHRHLYRFISSQNTSPVRETPKYLSASALTFLKVSLECNPSISHTVISRIKAPEQSSYRVQNEALEKLYVDTILNFLDNLVNPQLDNESESNAKTESESRCKEDEASVQKLYSILSLYDPEPNHNQKALTGLLTRLVKHSEDDNLKLNRHNVLSCLAGRSTTYLINQFVQIEEDLRKVKMTQTFNSDKVSDYDNPSNQMLTLSLCTARQEAWRSLFSFILQQQQHFLDQILLTSLEYIQCQKFSDLERLLSPEELHPLKPLVILMGWNHCYSSTHARKLLSLLTDNQCESRSESLERCCNKLAYQVDLIEWCLQRSRKIESGTSNQKATDLFRTLESHSVLYVLHHAAKLSSLDESEVLKLLEKTPNHTETMNGSLNKRVVRFADEDQSPSEEDGATAISLEQERDISIYRSYCALKHVMSAVKVCLDFAHLDLMNPLHRKCRRKSSTASFSSVGRSSSPNDVECSVTPIIKNDLDLYSGDNFQDFYTEHVWSRLETVKEHLSEVFPLTFRLETLENIFSLLFLTHEDIQETQLSDSDSEEAAGEEMKASVSSMDSVNLSNILSEDEGTKGRQLNGFPSINTLMTNSMESPNSAMDFDEPFENIYTKGPNTEVKHRSLSALISRENSVTEVPAQHSYVPIKLKDNVVLKPFNSPVLPKSESNQQISAASTQSNGSYKSLFKLGFMANEYVVRDVLLILRDCLFDLETAKFRLAAKESESHDKKSYPLKIDLGTEEKLTKVVPCSVTPDRLQKRASRLTQIVSEAQWRYQLVSHPEIPKQAGQVLTYILQQQQQSSDEELYDDGDEGMKKRRKRIPKIGKKNAEEAIGGETTGSQYTDGGYDSSRQRRSRSSSRRKSNTTTASVTQLQSGIIPSMLSSPESLLSFCLKRNQPAQANQVVKMFNLEDKAEIAEVAFSAKYFESVKKLQSFGSKSGHELGSSHSTQGRISMKMLANVAAAGMATASVSSITDELLSGCPIPDLPTPPTIENLPSHLQDVFNTENVPGLVIVDLSTTTCKTWDLCSSLLEIAKTLQKEVPVRGIKAESKALVGTNDFRPSGYESFLERLRELVQFAVNCQSPETTTADQRLTSKVIGSSPDICLGLSTHPCTTSGCRGLLAAIEVLKKTVEKAQNVLIERIGSPKAVRERTSPESSLSLRRASPQSISKQEQPVVHIAMKHLIHSLEKHVPVGGFVKHFIRNSSENVPATRNYLLSLYDHVKELAFLVAECEAKSTDSIVVPSNYFKMLEEGPISTLGRLMFVKKMQPNRLEKVAKKLSLNLTHIIVRSCCPRVPSKHFTPPLTPQTPQPKVLADGRTVLNYAESWPEKPRQPELTVRNLLTRLVQFMRDIAHRNNARGIFTPACADLVCQSTEFTDIAAATQELKFVKLAQLKNREEKICFFGNLQNLLTLHSYLYDKLKLSNQQKDSAETKSVLEWLIHTNRLAYFVGELGVISLFELRFVINRSGLHPPSMWNKLLRQRLYALDPVDPWFQYVPPPEPRLLFVTTDGGASSPPIQILSPDMVLSQLHRAMKDFLNHTVTIDFPKKQQIFGRELPDALVLLDLRALGSRFVVVTIPELLVWYRRDFSSEKLDQFDAPNEGLVNFISTQVTGATESDLVQLLQLDQVHEFGENIDSTGRKELPFTVRVQGFDRASQINFDFDTLKKGSHPLLKTHRRSFSLPPSLESSEDLSLGRVKESLTFQMTPITLEYIKNDSPLCATLVSLICSDELDDIEEHLEDNYFADSPPKLRKRSHSDISLVDIRSYRYRRLTDDYPILKRHLLNLVVPLAAAEDPDILKSGDPILKFVTSSISDKVKGCMLNLHSNQEYQSCLVAILNELFTAGDWKAILNILTYTFRGRLHQTPELKILLDFVVCCLVVTLSHKKEGCSVSDSHVITQSLSVCFDSNLQSRTALAVCKHLTLDNAINLIQLCLSNNNNNNNNSSEAMSEALLRKLAELNIYVNITSSAKSLTQMALNTADSVIQMSNDTVNDLSQLEQHLDWRSVQKSRPTDVLKLLIRAENFTSAQAWAKLSDIAETKFQEIEEKFILSLMFQSPPNTTRAFKSLESLLKENEEICFLTCQHLLETVNETENILFLTNFVLKHLFQKMSDVKVDEYRCMNMGAKALLCLPVSIRGEYEHLLTAPKLILEQLLMNTKADLASKVFQRLTHDFLKITDVRLILTAKEFDTLLIKYSRKAIEFPVVQVLAEDRCHSPSRSSPDQEVNPKSDFLSSMRGGSSRRSVDFSALNVNRPLLSSSYGVSPGRRAFSPPSYKPPEGKFVIPAEPPPKEKWVPDSSVSVCMVCQLERFSMFNRRHHCRRCGRVVCVRCSSKTSVIMGVSSRTCDDCYEQMFKPRLDKEFDSYQQKMRESLATSVSPLNRAPPTSSADSSVSGVQEFTAPGDIGRVIRHTEHEWKLKTDADVNIYVREEFYYEQAPSASLCISILSMMSSKSKAGQIMLELCDELSKMLRPIAPGVPNPEVDYSLVVSMMKHLLFRAKVTYIESGESHGLGMCDTYLSRVDLLNLLVSGNVSDIPSIQELTKIESVRRLRDRLIEDEHLLMAMEVSTKCGLETMGVWAAWGMACLHCADYTGAREKFNRCLKAPVDRNQSPQTSKLLSDIVDCLETMPSSRNKDVKNTLSSPGSIKSLVSMPPLRYVDESMLDKVQFEESVFYLKTYGTNLAIVQFFRRHGYLMKAAQYILDHKCSTDVFVEGLFMPSLTAEDLGKLEDQLTLIDPSLEKWNSYLTATCRHLMKSRLMNVLYHVQIFMKDFIRAAMNCITYFYQRGARTYLDLGGRVRHLFKAQSHLDSYLDSSKWGSVRPPSFNSSPKPGWSDQSDSSSVRLVQTPQEVKRYLNSVILQIEVTKYMEKSITSKPPDNIAMEIIQSYMSVQAPPPTLFGSSQVRADVVTMILMVGEDLLTSFDLSMKIIKEYRLAAVPILKHTAHESTKFHDYPRIHQLLECLTRTEFDDPQTVDEILGACIIRLKDDPEEAKEVDNFIKLIRLDSNKINAMILVGKLKSAYLLAVKSDRVEDVQRISGAAQRSGQNAVRNICNKWLSQRTKTT